MSLGLLSRAPDQVSTIGSTWPSPADQPRDPPAVLLAKDDRTARPKGLTVGRSVSVRGAT